jgi:hypothetical protein
MMRALSIAVALGLTLVTTAGPADAYVIEAMKAGDPVRPGVDSR